MRVTTISPAAKLLNMWLGGDGLDSQYNPDSSGARSRHPELAATIRPVAESMLELAFTDPQGDYVRILGFEEPSPLPFAAFQGPPQAVAVLNRRMPPRRVIEMGIFAPEDMLGMIGVALQVGFVRGQERATSQLNYCLSPLLDGVRSSTARLVSVLPCGSVSASALIPELNPDYFGETLGLSQPESPVSVRARDSYEFDRTMGFPGARRHLVEVLPSLPEYLTNAARSLT